jgi:hypothetical protein
MNFLKLKSIFSFFKKKLNLWTALESACFLYFGGIDFSNTDTQKMKNKINDPLIVLMVTWIIFLGYVICKIFWDHAIKSEKTSSDLIPLEIFSLLPILYSFFWVKKYIHPNPNRIEIFQFIGVIIFYFLLIKLNYSYYLTLLLLINLILLTSTNILTKRASSILEILGFLFLFLNLIIFFEIDSRPFFENYEAIGLVALNSIGFAIVFFKTESYLEKIKASLLIILMALQFIFDGIIVYLFYYMTILALLSVIILQEKLKIYIFRLFISFSLYIFLITGFLIIMIMAGSGKMGPSPNNKQDFIFITSILNLICFPLIAIFSKRILKKYKFINGEIDKDFILTILQFCGLTSLYIFIARLTLENNDFFAIISLIAINIILITTSNILTKKLSQILEIFSFIVLFIGLTILTWNGDEYFKYPLISYDNYVAIAIVIVNFIGFTMIFLRNNSYLERVKILIIFILMASFFRDKQSIFFNIFYYLASLALISYSILNEKLKPRLAFDLFFLLYAITSFFSFGSSSSKQNFLDVAISFGVIIALGVILISNYFLKKRKLKNDIQNLKINYERKNHEFR